MHQINFPFGIALIRPNFPCQICKKTQPLLCLGESHDNCLLYSDEVNKQVFVWMSWTSIEQQWLMVCAEFTVSSDIPNAWQCQQWLTFLCFVLFKLPQNGVSLKVCMSPYNYLSFFGLSWMIKVIRWSRGLLCAEAWALYIGHFD